jgi:hypothetical protein
LVFGPFDKDRQTELPKILHFADSEKIREMALRENALSVLEDRQALDVERREWYSLSTGLNIPNCLGDRAQGFTIRDC